MAVVIGLAVNCDVVAVPRLADEAVRRDRVGIRIVERLDVDVEQRLARVGRRVRVGLRYTRRVTAGPSRDLPQPRSGM